MGYASKTYFWTKSALLNQPPSVAVVILNYNGRGYLEQFLPSVLQSTYPNLEVIVADNRSTDDSIAWLRSHYPNVRLIENPSNEGYAQGYNLAIAQVTAEISILLNSDVAVAAGWIEPVVAMMTSHPQIAVCQPKILDWNRPAYFEYAGAGGGWIDSLGYPFSRGRVFDTCEADHGQYDTPTPIFWAAGAAFCIRTALFQAQGGFEPYFFAHQEEIDLCWRLQRSGYQIWYCPASVVQHVGGGTLPQGNPHKAFLNFRNNLIILWKHLPLQERCWKLPLRFALDAISAWKNLLAGNPGYFVAIAKAHAGLFHWWITQRRKARMPLQRQGPLDGYYTGSIVWEYFVKRRHTFAEIVSSREG